MTVFSIRLLVNGSETDVDVEADSADWTSKIGDVEVTAGGGGPLRPGQYQQLTMNVKVPVSKVALIRTVTVAVQGPWSGTAPAWGVSAGGGEYYKPIFHGVVHTIQGGLLDGYLRLSALSNVYYAMQRRARLSSYTNDSPYNMVLDMSTEHPTGFTSIDSLPSDSDSFSDGSTLIKQYRPVQNDTKNGDFVKSSLYGLGVNMIGACYGTLTTPAIGIRPDYFRPGVTTTYQHTFSLARPNLWNVTDLGISYQDFAARINVYGEDSGGIKYYGWARIDTAADRLALGNTDLSVTGWWNTAARCGAAALDLLQQTGYPASPLPYKVEANIEHLNAGMSGWAGNEEHNTWYWATAQVGDLAQWLTSGDTGYESLTGTLGLSTQRAADLSALFVTSEDNAGPGSAYGFAIKQWVVRGTTHRWDPYGGWTVELQLLPDLMTGPNDLTDTVSDVSSGTL